MTPAASSSRPSAWEWTQAVLLVANLAWTTLCLGGFRPETMIVTSALNGLLLAVHLAARAWSSAESGRRLHPAGLLLLPFLLYAAVNVLWVTPVPWLGWKDWLGWAQMILVFWVALNGVRATVTRAVVFGGLVAVGVATVLLAGYQRFVKPDWLMLGRTQADQFLGRSSGSFGIPNSLAALLLLLIPPLAILTLRRGASLLQRVLFGYLTVVFLLGLVLTISRGAWLSLALVLAVWPALAAAGPWLRRAGWAVLATLAVAGVFAALYFGLPRVRERFVQMKQNSGERTRPIMWRGAWQIFRAHPAWGGGAGSFNVLFEKYRPNDYQDEPIWAHNDYLNTLADYGAVGFALFFGAGAIVGIQCLRRRRPWSRDVLDERAVAGACMAGLAAFGLQLLVDFHFKIPALGMAFALVAALVVQRAWPAAEFPIANFGSRMAEGSRQSAPDRSGPSGVGRVLAAVMAAAVLAALLLWVHPFYRGEALRYSARQAINRLAGLVPTPAEQRATLTPVLADLERAVAVAPANAQAWSDLSYARSLWAHVEPARTVELGRQAEAAAARALTLAPAVPEFWLRRGVALDMQGRRSDAGAAFVEALQRAPASANAWYYHAYHLGLDGKNVALALAAVDFCLRLDPGNSGAQSLRQRLANGQRAP